MAIDVTGIIEQLAIAELPELITLGKAVFDNLDMKSKELAAANVAVTGIDATVDAVEDAKFPIPRNPPPKV